MNRWTFIISVWLLLGLVVSEAPAIASVEADPPGNSAVRVIEGRVIDDHKAPIEGAMILFGPADPPRLPFTEESTARTDARGHYRIDVAKFPWGSLRLRYLVLAPGFERAIGKVEAGKRTAALDLALTTAPWKSIELRMKDSEGRPVSGVEVTCCVEVRVVWSRLKTDGEGRCTIAMAIDQPIVLRASPENARPMIIFFDNTKDDPAALNVSLLPPIRGQVRDPEGRPVPDAVVGRVIASENWLEPDATREHDAPVMLPHFGGGTLVRTDSEGRFVLSPVVRTFPSQPKKPGEYQPPQTVCIADKDFHRFAYRLIDLSGPVEPLDVVLAPGRPVHIPVEWELPDSSPDALDLLMVSVRPRPELPEFRFDVFMTTLPRKGRLRSDEINLLLLEGKYILTIQSDDWKARVRFAEAEREFVVQAGDGRLELAPMRVEMAFHQKMVGKPAPEIETTDLDTGRPVHLADFRGQVVILDFWGYWCGPCLGSMPYLIDLHRRFEGQPLVIVGLHDQSVQSRSEYDRQIAFAHKEIWGGHDLPFRVLLDRPDPAKAADRKPEGTGLTCKRYALEGFPSLFVIDKEGTMIGKIKQHDRLEAIIRELLQKPAPR